MHDPEWPPPSVPALFCRYRRGEPWYARHQRRVRTALKHSRHLYETCRLYGAEARYCEGVWWFFLGRGDVYGWDPEVGKLYRLGDYDNAVKLHDVRQACFAIGWLNDDRTEDMQRRRRSTRGASPLPIDRRIPYGQRRAQLRKRRRDEKRELRSRGRMTAFSE